jgi:hypothetical protein
MPARALVSSPTANVIVRISTPASAEIDDLHFHYVRAVDDVHGTKSAVRQRQALAARRWS